MAKKNSKPQPVTKNANAHAAHSHPSHSPVIFARENYVWMLVGLIVFIIGLLLMAGGKSNNPHEFHPEQIYNFRRVTLAPIVIILGLVIEIYAIMKKSKSE